MRNHDAWLEQPYQDSIANGEALEALEEKYQESDEFLTAYYTWQQDSMSEFVPLTKSVLDTYLGTSEYREGLDAFIEAEAKAQEDEWAVYDSPESDEALRAWDEAPVLSRRKRIVRLLAKVVGR
jgi:hypothetical protein